MEPTCTSPTAEAHVRQPQHCKPAVWLSAVRPHGGRNDGASDRHGMATDFAHVRGDMAAQVHRPKIKANWRSRLTRLASVCLHIVFHLNTAPNQHFCEVRRLAPQVARHLFSARKPTALILCDSGRTAVSTPGKSRCAVLRSVLKATCGTPIVFQIVSRWLAIPQMISASGLGVRATGDRAPTGASGRS